MELESLFNAPGADLLVLTGWRGVGKTTFCQQVLNFYRSKSLSVSGLLSPGRFQDGKKTGIFVTDIASGETRLLASLVAGELNGIRLGQWIFDSEVFEWGNDCLKKVAAPDLLIIDEIGPLEFERQMGWMASFDVLKNKLLRPAIVIVRPEYIEKFSWLGLAYAIKEITG